jgi:hypothetical protein
LWRGQRTRRQLHQPQPIPKPAAIRIGEPAITHLHRTGEALADVSPALVTVNNAPRTPNTAAAVWSTLDTATADTSAGP